MSTQPVLIDGKWRAAEAASTFRAEDPAKKSMLADEYPISSWSDCDAALEAAAKAAVELRKLGPEPIAKFLETFAANIEANAEALVDMANAETGLPKTPRLATVELPRTTNQLRAAAAAAREGSWTVATIDTKLNIRSCYGPLGPVVVFGPNNFPFAFNSAAGGDFAAAIAAGNPVIAKASTSHPGTTRLFAVEAQKAAEAAGLPSGTIQLIYRTSHADGERLVSDPRIGATGYTGSRDAGLKLKAAADKAGKPIYLELSSVNPVLVLPGAIEERGEAIAEEFSGSCLMGAGQFCTNPGLVLLLAGPKTEAFVESVSQRFAAAPVGTLLSSKVAGTLTESLKHLVEAGATIVRGGQPGGGTGYSHSNTLLRASGKQFVENSHALQGEAFGNASLFVVAESRDELQKILGKLEGNLTGCIYSDTKGSDDALYNEVVPALRTRVGRLLNDKMPTGVAVTPAMNHGGPYPATGHPGFTAVGIPASMLRFAQLQCFDAVRPHRLPQALQDKNPNGKMWRSIDGRWTQGDVGS